MTDIKMEKSEMKHKEKIVAIGITLCILSWTPSVLGATTVTGTFTPIPTGVSIACNKTSPAFGEINLGASKANDSFNLTNEGDVNCSVTMTAEGDASGGWDLVAGTSSPATSDEFCINMDPHTGSYVDVQAIKTVSADIPPSGAGTNYSYFNLTVFVSDFTTQGTPGAQTFYTNLTAAALS